jgi:hypothetical protein
MHADADEATRERVHDHAHPVAAEHDRLASKEVHGPEAVVVWPMNDNHVGPGPPGAGRSCFDSTRETTFLSMAIPNVCATMRAIRGQPNRGLRELSSTMGASRGGGRWRAFESGLDRGRATRLRRAAGRSASGWAPAGERGARASLYNLILLKKEPHMALGFYFPPTAFTIAQYNEAIKRLTAAGAGHPQGRRYHACFGESDKLQVFDVWDSKEAFESFGAVLVPILKSVGVQHSEPMVMPIHNVIVPPARTARRKAKAKTTKSASEKPRSKAAKKAKRRA